MGCIKLKIIAEVVNADVDHQCILWENYTGISDAYATLYVQYIIYFYINFH